MARFGSAIVCAIAVLSSTALIAQPPDVFEYRVLLDTDSNQTTGCGVAVKDANIDATVNGVEQLVIIRAERTSPHAAQVVGVGRRVCGSGSFGPEVAVDPGDWPVGLDNGLSDADVVEGYVQLTALGDPDGPAQVAFSSTKVGGNSDVLLTTNGQQGAGPLLFDFLQASPAPAMAAWSVALAVLLMGLVAYATLRRYPRMVRLGVVALIVVIGGIVVAQVATITPDGAVDDWGAIPPLGTDVIHDSSVGDDAEDIVAAFMAQDNDNLYFRVDLLNVIDPAPTRTSTPFSTPTSTSTSPPMVPMNTATRTATSTRTATVTVTPTITATGSPTATPVDCSDPQTAEGTPCNDGNACTTVDTCQEGSCMGSTPIFCVDNPFPPPCKASASDCDPATGQCVPRPVADGTTCNDGNACTTVDTCLGGSCTGSTPVFCTIFLPTQCTVGAADCNPANGQCVPRPVLNGTACNDGNACTASDSCQAGVCTGTPCAEGHACCSQQLGCVDLGSDSANCGACGNQCMNSVCLHGQCFDGCVIDGVGYTNGTRNPANQCQQCDTSKSRTAWTTLGLPAQPNPFCELGCGSGICFSGNCMPVSQSGGCANRPCATGVCGANGCEYTPANEGAACTPPLSTSGCAATTGTCQSGECVPDGVNENGFCLVTDTTGNDCITTTGTCQSGDCVGSARPDGTACHGGLGLCVVGSCSSGQCQNTKLVLCPALPEACGVGTGNGSCNPNTGQCVYPTPAAPFPSGSIDCTKSDFSGPDPSKCCPGQVCICAPIPGSAGIPQFCFDFECWTPSDIP